jgi:diaminopimelate decarboxylase
MMSKAFEERVAPLIPKIADRWGIDAFVIGDAKGIRAGARRFVDAFAGCPEAKRGGKGIRNYYAVKAWPRQQVLRILFQEGMGFDCASESELDRAEEVGAGPQDKILTSNNTHSKLFDYSRGRCIINFDDVTFIKKYGPDLPEEVFLRWNPGELRSGNSIIGKPIEAKYGLTTEQLNPAFKLLEKRGVKLPSLHTMICSNERNYKYMVETIIMLLAKTEDLYVTTGIRLDRVNMGGGFGIQYHPTKQEDFNMEALGEEAAKLLSAFEEKHGWSPRLISESGRWVTGPHAVLVNRVINAGMKKYNNFVGVSVGVQALARPQRYGAYHHITCYDSKGRPITDRPMEEVHVVDSLCENTGRLTGDGESVTQTPRSLPRLTEGDFIMSHDVGAHGPAMAGRKGYNGLPAPAEFLLCEDDSVMLMVEPETKKDLRCGEVNGTPVRL